MALTASEIGALVEKGVGLEELMAAAKVAEILKLTAADMPSDRILREVSRQFYVPLRELKGRGRSAQVAEARQAAYYLIRKRLKYSYPKIGRLFERDQSTVHYGVDEIARKRSEDRDLWLRLMKVENALDEGQ
jgi:chromosomal replication initiation ATPase DnaA